MIETILKELTAMSVMPYGYLIMPVWGAFWTYFAFWFCSIKIFKDNIFLQLLLIYLGIFTINDALMQESILPNINIYLGLGILLTQAKFVYKTISNFIYTTKVLSYNLYTFVLTIYLKILKPFKWVYYKFNNPNDNKKHKQEEQTSYYEKQEYQYTYEENTKSSNEEEQTYNNYEETSSDNFDDTHKKDKGTPYGEEFAQFFSLDPFTVLGVFESDDYSTIKRSYRKLAKQYHPDTNVNELENEKYTVIFQNINGAFQKVEKLKK